MSFPTTVAMTAKEDSKFYDITLTDNSYNQALNGITYHWQRCSIYPKRIFTTGFTFITTAEKDKFYSLWLEKGKFDAFVWINPETSEAITVRFVEKPEFKYEGYGSNARWSFSVKIKEV